MKLELPRRPSVPDVNRPGKQVTYGTLFIDGQIECSTLEDEIREVPGRPVAEWKVFGETAIPAGEYEIGLRDSPKFGVDTIWVKGVPGYEFVLMHSGVDIDSTEGCIIVGDTIDEGHGRIGGGLAHQVLAQLKKKVIDAISRGETVTIDVRNPT